MGGAEFRAGQPRPFGLPNLELHGVGGSGGAGGGEPTEHVTGINPESVSLGQEFQVFNPLNTRWFTVLGSQPTPNSARSSTYYSFKILQTKFAPPIPFMVSASNWVDNGSHAKVFMTPLNPGLGHQVNTKDFTLSSRIEQYLQAPDFIASEKHKLAPLNFDVRSGNEYFASFDYYYPDGTDTRKNEYLVTLSREFDDWFRNTPESRELMRNLYFKLRSPSGDLASHTEEGLFDTGSTGGMLWFQSFFPTDTGPLPYDYAEVTRRGINKKLGAFDEGYNLKVPDNLDSLSLLRGSFHQLPSPGRQAPQVVENIVETPVLVTHATRRTKTRYYARWREQ